MRMLSRCAVLGIVGAGLAAQQSDDPCWKVLFPRHVIEKSHSELMQCLTEATKTEATQAWAEYQKQKGDSGASAIIEGIPIAGHLNFDTFTETWTKLQLVSSQFSQRAEHQDIFFERSISELTQQEITAWRDCQKGKSNQICWFELNQLENNQWIVTFNHNTRGFKIELPKLASGTGIKFINVAEAEEDSLKNQIESWGSSTTNDFKAKSKLTLAEGQNIGTILISFSNAPPFEVTLIRRPPPPPPSWPKLVIRARGGEGAIAIHVDQLPTYKPPPEGMGWNWNENSLSEDKIVELSPDVCGTLHLDSGEHTIRINVQTYSTKPLGVEWTLFQVENGVEKKVNDGRISVSGNYDHKVTVTPALSPATATGSHR